MKLKDKIKFGMRIAKSHFKDSYQLPLSTYFLITYKCPFSCRYCNTVNNAQKKEELPTNKILNLIDEMTETGTQKLHLTGGEPMIRDDIGEIIDRAKSKRIFTGLTSSGYFIPERIDALKDIDIVFLSFDGEESVHDYARGKGSYKILMEAMQSLRAKKIKFWTTTVINKTNKDSVGFILNMAKDKNFVANFQLLHSRNADYKGYFLSEEDVANFLMDPEDVKQVVSYLIQRKKQGERIGTSLGYLRHLLQWDDYSNMYEKSSQIRCWAGKLYCYLDADGKMYPCGSLLETVEGQDAIRSGFKESFYRLKAVPCQGCLSSCQTEQNLIFSFDLNTIANWIKFI